MTSRVKLTKPFQGNYEYCLWQLGTLQLLIRSSYHGICRHIQSDDHVNDESVTCYAKLEYQPQFGLEQITDKEFRLIWLESYLRHGANVLFGSFIAIFFLFYQLRPRSLSLRSNKCFYGTIAQSRKNELREY